MSLRLLTTDITTVPADAIVNAAISGLLGGGGVDGAVHAAGGPEILAECQRLRASTLPDGLPTGQAVATGAGELPARWVVHTVGPIHGEGTRGQLTACYANSLQVAAGLGARTSAFPLISAGVYGWPHDDAVRCALEVLAFPPVELDEISLVVFNETLATTAREVAASMGVVFL